MRGGMRWLVIIYRWEGRPFSVCLPKSSFETGEWRRESGEGGDLLSVHWDCCFCLPPHLVASKMCGGWGWLTHPHQLSIIVASCVPRWRRCVRLYGMRYMELDSPNSIYIKYPLDSMRPIDTQASSVCLPRGSSASFWPGNWDGGRCT